MAQHYGRPNTQLYLYDIRLKLHVRDEESEFEEVLEIVHTTIGMRRFDWQNDGTFRLNGSPYLLAISKRMGYWENTFYAAPSQGALKDDIEIAKRAGFNGCWSS